MSPITMRYRFDLEHLTPFSNKEKSNLTNLILSYREFNKQVQIYLISS